MSITQGLFSDVLANAPQPQGGSADWSKTLPMAGAVDWANVRPFQVINPLTGYSYGATQPQQPSASAQPEQPQMSEYQKWLAQQSKPAQYESGGGGRDVAPTSNLTDAQWAAVMENRNINGWDNPYDMAGIKGFGAAALGMLTGNPFAGMGQAYSFAKDQQSALDNLMAQKDAYTQAAQDQRAAEAAAMAAQAQPAIDYNAIAGGGNYGYGGYSPAEVAGGAGVAESYGGFQHGDASQGNWG